MKANHHDCELARASDAGGNRWTLLIVVDSPCFDQPLRVLDRQELMCIETLVAQAAVAGFDVAIVRRLPWPREIERHAAVERPRFDDL